MIEESQYILSNGLCKNGARLAALDYDSSHRLGASLDGDRAVSLLGVHLVWCLSTTIEKLGMLSLPDSSNRTTIDYDAFLPLTRQACLPAVLCQAFNGLHELVKSFQTGRAEGAVRSILSTLPALNVDALWVQRKQFQREKIYWRRSTNLHLMATIVFRPFNRGALHSSIWYQV